MVYLFQIYVNAGKPSQADAELAEIEKSHPGVVNQKAAQIFVGKAYSKAGDQEQAIRIWEKSLSELEDDGMKNAVRKMISDAKVPPATAEGVSSASKEK
jgi:predicted Zn-dependent protease